MVLHSSSVMAQAALGDWEEGIERQREIKEREQGELVRERKRREEKGRNVEKEREGERESRVRRVKALTESLPGPCA